MEITIEITDGTSKTKLEYDRELEDGEVFFSMSPGIRNLADALAEKLAEIEALTTIEVEPLIEQDERGRAHVPMARGVRAMEDFRRTAQACNLDLGPKLEEPQEVAS